MAIDAENRSLFCDFEQAAALEKLGFDEPCLAHYSNADPKTGYYTLKEYKLKLIRTPSQLDKGVKAPLYEQAFLWFINKYDLFGTIHKGYYWNISGGVHDVGYNSQYDWDSENYKTYKKAQIECLKKLIEICKK